MIRRPVSILALLALAAALAGCNASSVVDPIAAAATKSQQAGGVRISLRVEVTSPGLGNSVVTASGAFDREQGELTLDLSDLVQRLASPIGSGRDVKAIYATEGGDPVVYLRLPFLANALPGGKQWIRLDLQRAGSAFGIDFSAVIGQAADNPTHVLDLLRAGGPVEKVGPDTVDGTAATRYHATVDLKQALALKGVSKEWIQRLLDAGAPTALPVDVWIGDDDGLVHELRTTLETPAGSETVTTVTTLKLSDWGTTVTVEAPPAEQVFNAN